MEDKNRNDIRIQLKNLISGGFFHVFGSSTINKIIGFASTWVINRLISKPDYGVYSYAFNIYSFMLILSGLGITSSVLQMGSESSEIEKKDRYYDFGLTFGTTVDIVLAFLIVIIGLFIPLPLKGSGRLLALMCGLPLLTIIPDLQYVYLRINGRNKDYSAITLLNSIAVFALSCILSFLLKTEGLILAGYLSHIFTIIIANKRYKVPLRLNRVHLDKEEHKSLLYIALISMLNNGLSRLMYLVDVFVLGLTIPDSSVVAAYKTATNIPTALQFIPAALVIYIYPFFAEKKDNGKWLLSTYKKMIIPFGVFNILVSGTLFIFAEFIIKLLFGVEYLDSVTPFRILSIAYFFSATFRTISGNLLVTQRKLKFNLAMAILASAMNTLLNVFLIKAWGSNGAALSTLITSIVPGVISTVYLLVIFKRKANETDQLVSADNL